MSRRRCDRTIDLLPGEPRLTARPPESDWIAPEPGAWPDWSRAARVAVDTETYDPYLKTLGRSPRRGGYIAGVSLALEGGPSLYLPLRHEGGGNVEDPERAMAYVRDQARDFTGVVVGANIGYDLDYLAEEDVTFPLAGIRDVQVAEPILDEHRFSYALDGLGRSWLDRGKNEELLRRAAKAFAFDPKAELWRLPARYVGPYATDDAELPLAILTLQEREIAAQGLGQIYELETALIPLFLAMTRLGVRVDVKGLERLEDEYRTKERRACEEIKDQTGVDLGDGIWESERCAQALEHEGITCPRTPKTNRASVTVEFLEGLENPVARLLRRARKMNKARTTFCSQIRTHLVGNRVHCEWHQLPHDVEGGGRQGTVSGRPSATHPNLLFLPVRDAEIGPTFRALFLPEEGTRWGKFDFSQQEPRIAIAKATDLNLPGAAAVAQRYVEDPSTDCHQMMADLTNLDRRTAKEIYLGLIYGMGGGKLCEVYLNLPTVMKTNPYSGRTYRAAGPEGQKILNEFETGAPFFKKLTQRASAKANRDGFITTLLGRRCRFPPDGAGGYDWTYKALNRYVQGSAADQTKRAMLDVWVDLGPVPHLQVYDELDFSLDSNQDPRAIAVAMETGIPTRVPAKIDASIGANWGACA